MHLLPMNLGAKASQGDVRYGTCREGKGKAQSGMVLPFDPMTMTFRDLHYFVPIPKVLVAHVCMHPSFCHSCLHSI